MISRKMEEILFKMYKRRYRFACYYKIKQHRKKLFYKTIKESTHQLNSQASVVVFCANNKLEKLMSKFTSRMHFLSSLPLSSFLFIQK